jgi:hypothetical protein
LCNLCHNLASVKTLGFEQNFDLASGKERWDWMTGVLGRSGLGREAESHHPIFSYPDRIDNKI